MKQILLTLTILTLFTQDTNAARAGRVPYREICNDINQNFSFDHQGSICSQIEIKYKSLPTFANNICYDVMRKYETDTVNGRSFCEDQYKKIHADDEGPVALTSITNPIALPQPRLRQSLAADQCEQKTSEDFFCKIDSELILPDMASLYQSMSALPLSVESNNIEFTKQKCDCLETSVTSSNAILNLMNLDMALSLERKRINDLIINAAGKKLINNFASNLEDFNFFDTNTPRVLGAGTNSNQLACNQFADFRNTIMEKCRTSGINANVAEARLDKLMNSLGDLGSTTTAEQSFNTLRDDIMTYQLDPSKVFPGRDTTFTRKNYDRFRFGMSRTRPEVNFVNDITDLLLNDDVIGPQMMADIQSGTAPGRVLYTILKDEENPDTKRVLNRYLRKNKDSAFHRNLKAVMETENKEDYASFLLNTWDIATDMHPGLKAVFKDKALFQSIREKMVQTGNHSLLDTLGKSPGSLNNYFQEKCEKIKNDFAEATCTPDEDHMSRTNRDDLALLLSSVDSQLNPALKDVLLCRMPESNPTDSIFTRLAFKANDRINQADYFLMKVNPESTNATRFSQVAYGFSSGDEKTFRALNEITATGDSFRETFSGSDELASSPEAAEVATTENLSNLREILQQTPETPSELPVAEQPVTNYLIPQVAAATNQVPDVSNKDISSRNMLRDFLADKENMEEVDELLRNTKSEDHDELLRLREELKKNRGTISELMQESERMKLAELKRSYEVLEKEIADKKESQNSAGSPRVSEAAAPPVPQTSAIADASQAARNFEAPSVPTVNSGSGSASGSAGGSSTINRSIASEVSGAQNFNSTEKGAIVIESSTLRGSENSVRGDISAEVISYLEKAQPDIATLKQLKESGIILKFKVMENGKETMKELKVDYAALSPEARTLLERKITLQEKTNELEVARRSYSFSALKHLLGIKSMAN